MWSHVHPKSGTWRLTFMGVKHNMEPLGGTKCFFASSFWSKNNLCRTSSPWDFFHGNWCCTKFILVWNLPPGMHQQTYLPWNDTRWHFRSSQHREAAWQCFDSPFSPSKKLPHDTMQSSLAPRCRSFGCTAKQHGRHEALSIKPSHNTSQKNYDGFARKGKEEENRKNRQKQLGDGITKERQSYLYICHIIHVVITFQNWKKLNKNQEPKCC